MDIVSYTPRTMRYRLERYREEVKDFENCYRRLEMLNIQLEGVGAQNLNGMPKNPSPDTDRYVEPLSRKFEIEESIAQKKDAIDRERKALNYLVDCLESADERQVIRLRYLDGVPWSDVLFDLYGDRPDFRVKEESLKRNMRNVQSRAISNMARMANSGE